MQDVYFDATFKVVPVSTIYSFHTPTQYFRSHALMSRKTGALYVNLFEMLKVLAPQFIRSSAMADFEEAPVSAFRRVFGNANVSGCWFHYAQTGAV